MSNIADLKELSSSVGFWGTTTGFNSDRLCEILAFAVNSVEKLEEAERERDELSAERDGAMESALAVADEWVRRAKDAEAEIARRDAAAGEPFAYIDSAHLDEFGWGYAFKHSSPMRMACESPVYTAAPPAVLPDINNYLGGEWVPREVMLQRYYDDALALGAQQQKVVELPAPLGVFMHTSKVTAALDAAGVKWEVKK